jgi:hypothetical protein
VRSLRPFPPLRSRLAWRALFVVVAGWTGWPSAASANQSYPGDVDTALGVPGIVETKMAPTKGCQLCHTDPNGGTTSLTPFADYVVSQYGFPKTLVPEDAVVAVALAKLKDAEPKLWAHMQKGVDPNTDPALAEQAPPHPDYGCAACPPGDTGGLPWLAGAPLALVAARRRRLLKGLPARRNH